MMQRIIVRRANIDGNGHHGEPGIILLAPLNRYLTNLAQQTQRRR